MRPTVDIAITTYNQEGIVAETIESALAQSYGDLAVTIYDDCSTDGTEAVCRDYAARDARVTYSRAERNLGINGNFQRAMDNSRNPYMLILHGDDILYPEFIRETVELGLERHADAAFAYTLHERLVGGRPTGDMFQFVPALETGKHDVLKYLCLTNWIITSFAVMRRENLRRIGEVVRYLNKGTVGFIDHYLFSSLAATGPAYVVNKRLGAYRIHDQTNTSELVKSMRYKEGAIHCYDVIYQDTELFADKYRYLAKANQIGRLLTSRGIVQTAIDMMGSIEIKDLMNSISLEFSLVLIEALDRMVFDAHTEPARNWRLESPANLYAFSEMVLKKAQQG